MEIRERTEPPEELQIRIITPHSGLDAFTHAIQSIKRDFRQSRTLAWRILVRDTRAMYRRSLLGYVWLFLTPLATVFIWIFLNSTSLVSIETGSVPYPLFVIIGTVLWTTFNSSVMAMQDIMGSARGMLSKINFPHEALILAAFGKALMNSVIPIFLLLPALVFYGVMPGPSSFLFVIGFFTILLLGCAIGLIFVPLGSLYGDIGRAIQLGLRFGFFVTPVIYALPAVGVTRSLLLWNPVTAPLVSSRAWLIGGESAMGLETAIVLGISLTLLGLATIMFKVVMPQLIERLNS